MRKETGMAFLAAFGMAVLLVLMTCSCATKKKVTETKVVTEYVHDTVYSHSTDTVVNERIVHHTDTFTNTKREVITLIQREPGRVDTLMIERDNDSYHSAAVIDSTRFLRIAVDSLLKVLDRQHNENHDKETVRKQTHPWKWLIVGAVLFLTCLLILRSRS